MLSDRMLDAIVRHVCDELPDGYMVSINCVKGNAWVELISMEYGCMDIEAFGCIHDQVLQALELAKGGIDLSATDDATGYKDYWSTQ